MLSITKHKEHITIEFSIHRKLFAFLFDKIKSEWAMNDIKKQIKTRDTKLMEIGFDFFINKPN